MDEILEEVDASIQVGVFLVVDCFLFSFREHIRSISCPWADVPLSIWSFVWRTYQAIYRFPSIVRESTHLSKRAWGQGGNQFTSTSRRGDYGVRSYRLLEMVVIGGASVSWGMPTYDEDACQSLDGTVFSIELFTNKKSREESEKETMIIKKYLLRQEANWVV